MTVGRFVGFIGIVLGLFLSVALECCAAEGQKVLGLEDLIQLALSDSPELREVEQDIRAAQSDLDQAKAGQWAQLDVFAIGAPAPDADLPTVVIDKRVPGGGYIGTLEDHDKSTINVFGSLDVVAIQPLYTFGKISNRQDAAAAGLKVQKAAREKVRAEIVLSVKELYFGLIVAKQGLDAADDTKVFIDDARQRIKALMDIGSPNASEVDLHRLETFASEVESFKAKAESGARIAYLALKKKIGFKEDQDFQLDLKELPKDMRALDMQDEYIKKALENRPEMEQIKHGIEARKALVDAAIADLYPSFFLGAVGSVAGAPGRERMPISYFPDDFNHSEGGAFLGANWHFDFGITQARVDKARAEYQKMLHTKEYAERNIPLEVAKYYQDAIEYRKSFLAYEKGTVSARKWIVSAMTSYDMGIGTAKDMFDAIDRYGKNLGEYLQSLYSYHMALAKLSYAIGERWSGERGVRKDN